MNPIVGTKKLTYEMSFGMLGDPKGYPYLKVGELSCPKRFHPLKPIGADLFGFFGLCGTSVAKVAVCLSRRS